MTRFFEDFQPYYPFIASRDFSAAVDTGINFLEQTKRFSKTEYEAAHKGTPFYFLGLSAFLCHDYETGSFLVDAALSEDIANHPSNTDTPAQLFMRLETKDKDYAGSQIVEDVEARLNELTQEYRARGDNAGLTTNDVKRTFLKSIASSGKPELRSLTTTFIAYFAEWHHRSRLIRLTTAGSRELFYFHLFKGCVLFESIIKSNSRKALTQSTLGKILQNDLSSELNIPSPFSAGGSDLETIVRSLTNTLTVGQAIEKATQMRNSVSHNIAWQANSLDGNRYDLAATTIGIASLHAIAKLYL